MLIIDNYNVDEEYLYNKPYLFIKGFATAKGYVNTLKALSLARYMHNGQYRRGTVNIDGKDVKLPYVLHVLKVCSTLIALNLPLNDDELDILYCSALCHDMIEDCKEKFPKGGIELYEEYGIDSKVYGIVKKLSKRSGATQDELDDYFNTIKYDKLALLIKLSDRGHNVETLSCMKIGKIHKYVEETRNWIYPLCSYAKQTYPELSNGISILKSKIVSLTEATETLVDMFMEQIEDKNGDKKDGSNN